MGSKAENRHDRDVRMSSRDTDYASIGQVVDQVHRDFCQVRPDSRSSEMLREMVGATFAGIQALPVGSRYNFDYLVQAGFDVRPWVHSKVCKLSRDAQWDVRGVDHRSSSDIYLFDIFERLPSGGAGGQLRSYFDHIGVRHALMSTCVADDGWQYVMFAGRSPGQDAFDEADRARLRAMLPHFRRALRARTRLVMAESMAKTCASGMESFGVGVVLINDKGHIAFMNDIAERMIAAGEGLLDKPRFGATSATANQRLQGLLRAAAREDWSGGGVAIAIPRSSGDGQYELVIDAQPRPLGMSRRGEVIVYLRDRPAEGETTIDAALLQQFFHLTEAEALVAGASVSGRSTQEIARHLGIQYNTVRAHFRSIYAKCGWSNRSDLVQMVLRSPAVLGESRSAAADRRASLS